MVSGFHAEYEARWGNRFESLAVQGVTYRVEAVIPAEKVSYRRIPKGDGTPPRPSRSLTIRYLADRPVDAAEYRLSDLRAGDTFVGAAVVREALSTTFVLPGQHVRVGEFGELHITRPATDDGGPT
jgi:N-methylhydantoinase A